MAQLYSVAIQVCLSYRPDDRDRWTGPKGLSVVGDTVRPILVTDVGDN